jgi:hypothetical protein
MDATDVVAPNQPVAVEKLGSKPRRATRQAQPKTELQLLADISAKFDRLMAVMAAQGKDRDTQVAILASANCDSGFVGTLIGMSPGAVRKLPAWKRAQERESGPDEQEDSPK